MRVLTMLGHESLEVGIPAISRSRYRFHRSIIFRTLSWSNFAGCGLSRLRCSASIVGVFEETPPGGISSFATQAMPLSTTVRKLSLAQLQCEWQPVKPNPRPPSGRTRAQATCSALPFCDRTVGFPLCGPSGRSRVLSGGTAVRMGVTPSMLSINRML